MFTGIIRELGTVIAAEDLEGGGRTLTIEAPATVRGLEVGASVAVDGACLTAVSFEGGRFRAELVASTLARTIAGGYRPGSRVNLEPAARADAALDGHIVQGHVDGVGELILREREGNTLFLEFRIPSDVGGASIPRGSIALNGVSLTIADLPSDDRCRVAIIPHTAEVTNLGALQPGDRVNLEGDLIGKYVGRYLARIDEERLGAGGSDLRGGE